jgi:hypothetical protein
VGRNEKTKAIGGERECYKRHDKREMRRWTKQKFE